MFQLMDSENIGDQSSYKETLRTPNVASDRKLYKGQEFDNLEKKKLVFTISTPKRLVLELEFILVEEVGIVMTYSGRSMCVLKKENQVLVWVMGRKGIGL